MVYEADYKLYYCGERKPNMRGSYLFIISEAIIFDKLGLPWSTENTETPHLYPTSVHSQTSSLKVTVPCVCPQRYKETHHWTTENNWCEFKFKLLKLVSFLLFYLMSLQQC